MNLHQCVTSAVSQLTHHWLMLVCMFVFERVSACVKKTKACLCACVRVCLYGVKGPLGLYGVKGPLGVTGLGRL